MTELLMLLMPALVGSGFWWIAGKSRGKNARTAFRFAAWGAWLWYLTIFAGAIPLLPNFLAKIVLLAPSVLCFLLAASSLLKEMRAQKNGDFTDVA